MIIDLSRFIAEERPFWEALASLLDRLERDPGARLDMAGVKRFHYLYERTSADLAKIATFSSEPELRRYLESIVGRAYAEIHETRDRTWRFALRERLFSMFPRVFRRHAGPFRLAAAIMLAGIAFGGLAVRFDAEAKGILVPFEALQTSPSDRVAEEEDAAKDRLGGRKATFSSTLITHNARVSLFVLALGMTWGIGTVILLFYNGAVLGAVCADYALAGQTKFLFGWLLPHGAVEIPAILIAGQAGLLLAGALIGREDRLSTGMRLRNISGDLVALVIGIAGLLVWAGFVEAFISQYHEPVVPYSLKIGFGIVEIAALALFLIRGGSKGGRGGRID
ncbi:MAG: stage II sporulation protein M [Deltaproteobacteria bacterium]|nr:stage II sporulation protein M [Deltaproteobacteria bacterium]